jgi:hypothetical protein
MRHQEQAIHHGHSGPTLLPYVIASWFWAFGQTIPVRVCNLSSAAERDIRDMTRTTEAVFQHSGIHVRWLECTSDSQGDRVFSLTLVNGLKVGTSQALGCTTLNSTRMSVFFAQAKNVSVREGIAVSPGQIMGYLAAHEIFHAVVRTSDHALFGIMKAPYRRRDLVKMSQGTLFFTTEQKQMLQSQVSADHATGTRDLVATDREPKPRRH